MKCLKCGRMLRSPESVKAGYGPVCYEKLFGKPMKNADNEDMEEEPDLPGQITFEEFLETAL